ncbi:hypothetical protein BC938DRAFT_474834 [Jimgerdemannia flammicorona]|uniref:Major facilitator superfamily (MFS) profile domain-containing protein n=1 Tax=Jimgerdemannia flammicorona TaxID=994334 RepID=A0A433Q1F2_9FUNG|nr:hypothetical protein BC938DRAFT_474834 [Jimgerdemannia flammicorona]
MDLQDTFGGIEAVQLPVPSDWKGDTVELATANLSTTNLSEIDSPQNEEKKPQDDEKKTFYQTLLLFLGLVVATFLDSLDGTLLVSFITSPSVSNEPLHTFPATNLSAIATELKNVEDMAWTQWNNQLFFLTLNNNQQRSNPSTANSVTSLGGKLPTANPTRDRSPFPLNPTSLPPLRHHPLRHRLNWLRPIPNHEDPYCHASLPGYRRRGASRHHPHCHHRYLSHRRQAKVYGHNHVRREYCGKPWLEPHIASSYHNYRWSFYINGPIAQHTLTIQSPASSCFQPLGFITILSVLFLLRLPRPKTTFKDQIARVDFLGTALLIATIFALLLPLTYGGTKWAWNSAEVIGLLFAFVILLALFILVEVKFAKEPTIPAHIFKVRTVTAVVVAELFQGMAYIGLIWFTPVFVRILCPSFC